MNCNHIDCCEHCKECFPPENRSLENLRRKFGSTPIYDTSEGGQE